MEKVWHLIDTVCHAQSGDVKTRPCKIQLRHHLNYLLYEAENCEASEMRQFSEAEMRKASEQRKLEHERASEKKKLLNAVHKRLKAEETREYAARKEEATEMRTQQECILNGGVYLRHRLEK